MLAICVCFSPPSILLCHALFFPSFFLTQFPFQAEASFGPQLSALCEVHCLVCSYLHQMFIAEPSMVKLVHFQCYPLQLLPMMEDIFKRLTGPSKWNFCTNTRGILSTLASICGETMMSLHTKQPSDSKSTYYSCYVATCSVVGSSCDPSIPSAGCHGYCKGHLQETDGSCKWNSCTKYERNTFNPCFHLWWNYARPSSHFVVRLLSSWVMSVYP